MADHHRRVGLVIDYWPISRYPFDISCGRPIVGPDQANVTSFVKPSVWIDHDRLEAMLLGIVAHRRGRQATVNDRWDRAETVEREVVHEMADAVRQIRADNIAAHDAMRDIPFRE